MSDYLCQFSSAGTQPIIEQSLLYVYILFSRYNYFQPKPGVSVAPFLNPSGKSANLVDFWTWAPISPPSKNFLKTGCVIPSPVLIVDLPFMVVTLADSIQSGTFRDMFENCTQFVSLIEELISWQTITVGETFWRQALTRTGDQGLRRGSQLKPCSLRILVRLSSEAVRIMGRTKSYQSMPCRRSWNCPSAGGCWCLMLLLAVTMF